MIRILLPVHLRTLAVIEGEVYLEVLPPITLHTTLTMLEKRFPSLRGTIRDPMTFERRPYIRFFACKQDLSFSDPSRNLPEDVINGVEPLIILGAIAGG